MNDLMRLRAVLDMEIPASALHMMLAETYGMIVEEN